MTFHRLSDNQLLEIMKLRVFFFVLVGALISIQSKGQVSSKDLRGAWELEMDGNKVVWINAGQYFSAAVYNVESNEYVGTAGGMWRLEGDRFVEVQEFNTMDTTKVGKEQKSRIGMKNNNLVFTVNGKEEVWSRIDDGTPGQLEGAWLITGRYRDGAAQKRVPGARKTMKILSGTRFQWIAYNVDTKEFFGTGGGTYTTKDGKYIENIEFFSRDKTRVGASLGFNYEIMKDGDWRHSGKSSKGDPLDENWTKRENLEK
jgi:hypothetical protein